MLLNSMRKVNLREFKMQLWPRRLLDLPLYEWGAFPSGPKLRYRYDRVCIFFVVLIDRLVWRLKAICGITIRRLAGMSWHAKETGVRGRYAFHLLINEEPERWQKLNTGHMFIVLHKMCSVVLHYTISGGAQEKVWKHQQYSLWHRPRIGWRGRGRQGSKVVTVSG